MSSANRVSDNSDEEEWKIFMTIDLLPQICYRVHSGTVEKAAGDAISISKQLRMAIDVAYGQVIVAVRPDSDFQELVNDIIRLTAAVQNAYKRLAVDEMSGALKEVSAGTL